MGEFDVTDTRARYACEEPNCMCWMRCEEHTDREWPHGNCLGPGMPHGKLSDYGEEFREFGREGEGGAA